MKKDQLVKRFLMMLFGIWTIGVAIAVYNRLQLGADPYTCMNYGISDALNLSFGVTQLIINSVLALIGLFFDRRYVGIGMLVNWVGVGFIADWTTPLVNWLIPEGVPVWGKIVILVALLVFQCFGSSLFFTAALGVGPYDIIHFVLKERIRMSYRVIRILIDVICVTVGFLLGSTIGIGTLILALGIGPLVQFFTKHCAEPFMNRR